MNKLLYEIIPTYVKEKRNACRALLGKPQGKRPVERTRHSLEDNIKMDMRDIGWSRFIWFRIWTSWRI